MDPKDDGGTAFPVRFNRYGERAEGMSQRDYFAARAMQAIFQGAGSIHDHDRDWCARVASISYEMADAMLEARKQ